MNEKYTRLKLKMLLWVIVGTLITGAVGIFLLEVVVDGVLQDPIYRFFVWCAQTLFGQSAETADQLYQQYLRNNKQEILTLGTMVLMLIAFYIAMGRFTRWLDEIRTATRRLLYPGAEPVELPRELHPIQEDLNAIRQQLSALGLGLEDKLDVRMGVSSVKKRSGRSSGRSPYTSSVET